VAWRANGCGRGRSDRVRRGSAGAGGLYSPSSCWASTGPTFVKWAGPCRPAGRGLSPSPACYGIWAGTGPVKVRVVPFSGRAK
jgi:hypothetical protein